MDELVDGFEGPLRHVPGGFLEVRPRQAFVLARVLDEYERRAARANGGGGLPAELSALRAQLRAFGEQWRHATDVDVSASVPRVAVGSSLPGADLLTADEAADLLGVTPHGVRDLGRRTRLTVHRIGVGGRFVRFDPVEVLAYRDERDQRRAS